jgi:transcriptional regulator with XRE-family HTH domain
MEIHPSAVGIDFRKPYCPKGHFKPEVGVYGYSCAACHNELAQRNRANGKRYNLRSEWCTNGHHKPTVGLTHNNGCAECRRTTSREQKRKERARKYGAPVELFGAGRDYLELRKLRESLGLTIDDLSRISGVPFSTVKQLEDRRSKGWPTTRKKLLEALSPRIKNRTPGRYTRLAAAVAEAQRRGKPYTSELARVTDMPQRQVATLLGVLRRRGIVERVGDKHTQGVWSLTTKGKQMLGRAA